MTAPQLCQVRVARDDLADVSSRQATHIVVETRPRNSGGCGTVIAVLVVVGLTIRFWYVPAGAVVVCLLIAAVGVRRRRLRERRRPGPRDPWLNEVAVSLLDLGVTEFARNTETTLGGAPVQGDLIVRGRDMEVRIVSLPDARRAHECEMGLRADATFRRSLTSGRRVLRTAGREVFIVTGRRTVADEFLLDEVVRVVGRIPPGET